MIFIDWLGHRWFAWLGVVVGLLLAGAIGLGAVAAAGEGSPWWPVLVLIAASWLPIAYGAWGRFLAPRRPLAVALDTAEGTVSVAIWRPALTSALAVVLPFVVVGGAGLVTAQVVGSPRWPWIVALVFGLVLAPQLLVSWFRRPALVLRVDTVTYRGPTVDAGLAWDDVAGIEESVNGRGPVLAVRAFGSPPSWVWSRRFWVTPVEMRTLYPGLEVEVQGPRDAELLDVLAPVMQEYRHRPALRTEIGTPAFLERLDVARRRRS